MLKNFSKTIFTIVFVVFLGLSFINDVYAAQFDCYLNGFTLTYDSDGNLVAAKDNNGAEVKQSLSSLAKPKSKAECPSASEYKVTRIDGGRRNLYIAGIDESFSSVGDTSLGNNKPSYLDSEDEEKTEEEQQEYAGNIGTLASDTETVGCGTVTGVPSSIPKTVNIIYKIIQIFVPLALIIFGMFDMAKAVMGQKEDEIKKGQQTLIKRIIAAAIVFFVFAAIKLVVSFVSDSSDVMECLKCFIDNDCKPEVKAGGGNNT